MKYRAAWPPETSHSTAGCSLGRLLDLDLFIRVLIVVLLALAVRRAPLEIDKAGFGADHRNVGAAFCSGRDRDDFGCRCVVEGSYLALRVDP